MHDVRQTLFGLCPCNTLLLLLSPSPCLSSPSRVSWSPISVSSHHKESPNYGETRFQASTPPAIRGQRRRLSKSLSMSGFPVGCLPRSPFDQARRSQDQTNFCHPEPTGDLIRLVCYTCAMGIRGTSVQKPGRGRCSLIPDLAQASGSS